jgi:hypothetical protein
MEIFKLVKFNNNINNLKEINGIINGKINNLEKVNESINYLEKINGTMNNLEEINGTMNNLEKVNESINYLEKINGMVNNLEEVNESINNLEEVNERINNLEVIESIDNLKVIESIDNLKVIESIDNLKVIESIDNLKVIESIDNLKVIESINNLEENESINNLEENESIDDLEINESIDDLELHNIIKKKKIKIKISKKKYNKQSIDIVQSNDIDTLCFSSGGVQGISFLASIKYFIDNKYIDLDKITTYVGTSVGSIICFLFLIGYTPDELINFILTFDFSEIEPDFDLNSIYEDFGCDNGNKLINIIKRLALKKINLDKISMYDLYLLTKKKLIINTTNFTTGIETILSYKKTPNLCIFKAIRMSSSVPIIFTPVSYNNDYFIDGALTNHILLTQCDPKRTFGLNIIYNKHNQLESLQDVLYGSLSILFNKGLKQFKNYKMMNIKNIDSNVTMINISNEYIHKLLNNGIKFSKKFYKNELNDKINRLKKKLNNNKKFNGNI